MAEERADRAEAEAHDANVESQLAGTLGIKVCVILFMPCFHFLNLFLVISSAD